MRRSGGDSRRKLMKHAWKFSRNAWISLKWHHRDKVRNTLCAALERTRSPGRKSRRANAGGLAVQDGVLPFLCVFAPAYSKLGNSEPAMLEKEADVRRKISWMQSKVSSPLGRGRLVHTGCSLSAGKSFFLLPPFTWTLLHPLLLCPWNKWATHGFTGLKL